MPELPDVETFKRRVDRAALGKRIHRIRLIDASLLQAVSPRRFRDSLREQTFARSRRHGKYLGIRLANGKWVMFHFGLTGELLCLDADVDIPGNSKLVLNFDDESKLVYTSQRKLGMFSLVEDFDTFVQSKQLGPDALDVDASTCRALIKGRRSTAKAALMNQSILAGIGNIYSDEILFQVHIHPKRQLTTLSSSEIRSLCRSLNRVLRIAIERRADPEKMPRSWLLPRRGTEQQCPRCRGNIRKTRIGGRSAYFCPACQH